MNPGPDYDRELNGEPRAPPELPAIRLPPYYRRLPFWRRVIETMCWWPRWAMRQLSPTGALERWVRMIVTLAVAVAVPLIALVAVLPMAIAVVSGLTEIAFLVAKATAALAGTAVVAVLVLSWLRRG